MSTSDLLSAIAIIVAILGFYFNRKHTNNLFEEGRKDTLDLFEKEKKHAEELFQKATFAELVLDCDVVTNDETSALSRLNEMVFEYKESRFSWLSNPSELALSSHIQVKVMNASVEASAKDVEIAIDGFLGIKDKKELTVSAISQPLILPTPILIEWESLSKNRGRKQIIEPLKHWVLSSNDISKGLLNSVEQITSLSYGYENFFKVMFVSQKSSSEHKWPQIFFLVQEEIQLEFLIICTYSSSQIQARKRKIEVTMIFEPVLYRDNAFVGNTWGILTDWKLIDNQYKDDWID